MVRGWHGFATLTATSCRSCSTHDQGEHANHLSPARSTRCSACKPLRIRSRWREIEILGGLLLPGADRGYESEITHVRKIGVTQFGGIKHHAHMIDQAGLGGGLRIARQSLAFCIALFLAVRKDLGK